MLVFIGIIGGTPDKPITEGLYFFGFVFFLIGGFYRHYRGGTPNKRIPEGLIYVFFIILFEVFIGIIGGTPDKRIPEGLL